MSNADSVFYVCLLILIILCTGDPDILDGLIKMVNK
jgi:hypothetical protein